MRWQQFSEWEMPRLCVSWVGCSDDARLTRYGPARREPLIVHYCISGAGFFNGNRVKGGEGFLIRPNQLVEYHPDEDDPWAFFWFIVETDSAEELLRLFPEDPETGIFCYSFVEEMREQFHLLKTRDPATVSPLDNAELFLKILQRQVSSETAGRKQNRATRQAQYAKSYLENNCSARVSVLELARHMNMSQPNLYKMFTREFGVSPKMYLNEYRIRQAKILLEETDLNISQVADAVGYDDVLVFSSFFSKKVGCAPTVYRKQNAKNGE